MNLIPLFLMLALDVAADWRLERWEEVALQRELSRWPPAGLVREAERITDDRIKLLMPFYNGAGDDPFRLHDEMRRLQWVYQTYGQLDWCRTTSLSTASRWRHVGVLRDLVGDEAFFAAHLPEPAPWWRWP